MGVNRRLLNHMLEQADFDRMRNTKLQNIATLSL